MPIVLTRSLRRAALKDEAGDMVARQQADVAGAAVGPQSGGRQPGDGGVGASIAGAAEEVARFRQFGVKNKLRLVACVCQSRAAGLPEALETCCLVSGA